MICSATSSSRIPTGWNQWSSSPSPDALSELIDTGGYDDAAGMIIVAMVVFVAIMVRFARSTKHLATERGLREQLERAAIHDPLHHAGDRLLREVARRLTDGGRAADTVGRLGGDAFAVVIDDIDPVEGLALRRWAPGETPQVQRHR